MTWTTKRRKVRLALPGALRRQLKQIARAADRSFSNEVVLRLEASMAPSATPAPPQGTGTGSAQSTIFTRTRPALELRPCAVCGRSDRLTVILGQPASRVACIGCEAEEAAAEWNARIDQLWALVPDAAPARERPPEQENDSERTPR